MPPLSSHRYHEASHVSTQLLPALTTQATVIITEVNPPEATRASMPAIHRKFYNLATPFSDGILRQIRPELCEAISPDILTSRSVASTGTTCGFNSRTTKQPQLRPTYDHTDLARHIHKLPPGTNKIVISNLRASRSLGDFSQQVQQLVNYYFLPLSDSRRSHIYETIHDIIVFSSKQLLEFLIEKNKEIIGSLGKIICHLRNLG